MKNKLVEEHPQHLHVVGEYFYAPHSQLVNPHPQGWEHHETHFYYDPEAYYYNMPPIEVKKVGKVFHFENGHHRINFCIFHDLPVPCIINKIREDTHLHEFVSISNSYVVRVTDGECKQHLNRNPRFKCYKNKKSE